jgi:hypothetical protein
VTQRLMSARSCRQRWHCRSASSRHSGGRRRQSSPCLPSSQQACAVWKAELPPLVPKRSFLVSGRQQYSAQIAPALQERGRQLHPQRQRPQLQRLPHPASHLSRAGSSAQNVPRLQNLDSLRLQAPRLSAASAELRSRWPPEQGRFPTSSGGDTTATPTAMTNLMRTRSRRSTTAQPPPVTRTHQRPRGLTLPTLPSAATATGRRGRIARAAARTAAARPRGPPKRSAFASTATALPLRPRAARCQPSAGAPAAALEAARTRTRARVSAATPRLGSPSGATPAATRAMMMTWCTARAVWVQRSGEARGEWEVVVTSLARRLRALPPLLTGAVAGQLAGG